MSNRSFVLPILLIGLGALFLVSNAVPGVSVWQIMATWWPVALIGLGVIRLIEVLALYGTGRGPTTETRSSGSGWISILVLVFVVMAAGQHFGAHYRWDTAGFTSQFTNMFGEEFDFPVSIETGVGDAKRVVLDHMRGSVTINGADRNDIQLTGHKTIRAADHNAASKIDQAAAVTFTREGDSIFIQSANNGQSPHARISVDMEISIPSGMSVEARGRSGDLTVNSIHGDIDVSSQRGEVRLQDIGGGAKIDVDHSGLVRATNVKGPVDLQGTGGDVQLEHVDGLVTINGQFSGTLDFKAFAKPLHFESKETDFRVEAVPGNISLSLSELHGTNISGPIHFVTHERDVNLDDFAGPVDIEIGHGDVELKPSAATTLARIDVRSRSGNIEMALPVDKPFDLRATAQQGEISNDYGDSLISQSGPGRTNSLRSSTPAGPAISLVTERGEVSVRKLE